MSNDLGWLTGSTGQNGFNRYLQGAAQSQASSMRQQFIMSGGGCAFGIIPAPTPMERMQADIKQYLSDWDK